jgi:hypothetical protein
MAIRGLSPRLGNLIAKHIPFGASLFGSQSAPTVSLFPSTNQRDWRVKLTVGSGAADLITGPVFPTEFQDAGGIIFPYTPIIFIQQTASYGSTGLTHSNYDHPAFESHNIGEIQITCPFTANSKAEADMFRAALHFMRIVTKMYFGQDPQAGTPPPVLRLNAYGDHIFKNVPVVVTNFTIDMANTVDYIATSDGKTMIPASTTLTCNLKPAYSRAATAKRFGLKNFADGSLLGNDSQGGFI